MNTFENIEEKQIEIFERVFEKQLYTGKSPIYKHKACKYCGADGEGAHLSLCGNREYICRKCKKLHDKAQEGSDGKLNYSHAKKFGEGWTDSCNRHHDGPYQDQFGMWHRGFEKGDVWDDIDDNSHECCNCGVRSDEPSLGDGTFIEGPDGEMYCGDCYDQLFEHEGFEKGDVRDIEEVSECKNCGVRSDEPSLGDGTFLEGPDGKTYCGDCYDQLFL